MPAWDPTTSTLIFGARNPPAVLADSRGYLEDYGQLRDAALPDQELFEAMVDRYPGWVSRQQWLMLEAVA